MWETRLEELMAFRTEHGHLDVPRGWPQNPALARWVINQRRLIRRGLLAPERLARLHELEIAWPSAEERLRERERDWDRMCDTLAAHHREHGPLDIPSGDGPAARLARWAARQRHLFRSGSLREDRRQRLFALGIDWMSEPGRTLARDGAWDRMYAALVAFTCGRGHCRVPKGWAEDPALSRWLIRQRHQLRTRSMPSDRRQRLEALGVGRPLPPSVAGAPSPGRRERTWRSMFASLRAFRSVHGHCTVPRRWPWNRRLARWIHHQRELHRGGRLSREREQFLNGLGVVWAGGHVDVPAPRTAVRVH